MLRVSVKNRLTGGENFFLFKSGENPVNNRFLTGGKNRLITGFSPDLSGGEMVRLVNRTIFACIVKTIDIFLINENIDYFLKLSSKK